MAVIVTMASMAQVAKLRRVLAAAMGEDASVFSLAAATLIRAFARRHHRCLRAGSPRYRRVPHELMPGRSASASLRGEVTTVWGEGEGRVG